MKKVVCLFIAVMLCLNVLLPAYADEGEFVPSIAYKPNPEVEPVEDEDGGEHFGVILNAVGEILGYIEEGCLRITPIAHLWDDEHEVPEEVKNLLTYIYDSLINDTMSIPYDKHNAGLNPADMVIRDLFDARFYCTDHPEMLEGDGTTLELTFDLGVVPDAEIYVQTYNEETKEWEPIVKAVNNGDGTVTCTFEHLCAVAFSMVMPRTPVSTPEEPSGNAWIWILALVLAAIVAVIVIIVAKKKKKAA